MAEAPYDHVDPRTDAEVARDAAEAKAAVKAKHKARSVSASKPAPKSK